jgi:hypothetical protein
MTVVALLLAALWALAWAIACAREAVRLHRQLYPRGIRFVFSPYPTTQPHKRGLYES